jgi:hypothetical protein
VGWAAAHPEFERRGGNVEKALDAHHVELVGPWQIFLQPTTKERANDTTRDTRGEESIHETDNRPRRNVERDGCDAGARTSGQQRGEAQGTSCEVEWHMMWMSRRR